MYAGGMLATWMRIKYPHILDGAIAGSAPIWSYLGEVRMHYCCFICLRRIRALQLADPCDDGPTPRLLPTTTNHSTPTLSAWLHDVTF